MTRLGGALCAVMGLGCASTVGATAGDASDVTDVTTVDVVDAVDARDVVDAQDVVDARDVVDAPDVTSTPDAPVTDDCFDGVVTLATEPGSRALMTTTRDTTFVTWRPVGASRIALTAVLSTGRIQRPVLPWGMEIPDETAVPVAFASEGAGGDGLPAVILGTPHRAGAGVWRISIGSGVLTALATPMGEALIGAGREGAHWSVLTYLGDSLTLTRFDDAGVMVGQRRGRLAVQGRAPMALHFSADGVRLSYEVVGRSELRASRLRWGADALEVTDIAALRGGAEDIPEAWAGGHSLAQGANALGLLHSTPTSGSREARAQLVRIADVGMAPIPVEVEPAGAWYYAQTSLAPWRMGFAMAWSRHAGRGWNGAVSFAYEQLGTVSGARTWSPEGQPERWAVDAVTVSVDERAPRTIVAWTASGVGDDGRRGGAVYVTCARE
ncbi:MAG: hypothetical protein R3A52_14925 [Polyangiales bacterium]